MLVSRTESLPSSVFGQGTAAVFVPLEKASLSHWTNGPNTAVTPPLHLKTGTDPIPEALCFSGLKHTGR
jgi:hypothetical protein